jgi:WD40 repeat protein
VNKKYNKIVYDGENSFCMVGKEVLPFLFDCDKDIITWSGKNVPNDDLDLRVPINDTDATFFRNKNSLACAHADSKVRIYDIRTNKQKPSADYHLKLEKVYTKANLTKIRVSPLNENMFYVSNDLGAIYECDIRHQMRVTGKFKGINSTVTDIAAHDDKLFASSLDSYVRVYNLESKELEEKHYMNKPIYSIKILEGSGEEEQDFKEEALSDEEEQQVP